jgi:hypothetical protein
MKRSSGQVGTIRLGGEGVIEGVIEAPEAVP